MIGSVPHGKHDLDTLPPAPPELPLPAIGATSKTNFPGTSSLHSVIHISDIYLYLIIFDFVLSL